MQSCHYDPNVVIIIIHLYSAFSTRFKDAAAAIKRNRDFHDYLTRSRFNLLKMSLYQYAISSQAPTIWNDIPLTVRDNLTTTNFKKKLKFHF